MSREINQIGRNAIAAFLLDYHKNGIFISRDKDIINSYTLEIERAEYPLLLLQPEQSRTGCTEAFRLQPNAYKENEDE